MPLRVLILLLLMMPFASAGARAVYQAPQDFIADAFAGAVPKARVLWITKKLKPRIREILGHDYPVLRVRYWLHGGRSAWILDEVGKERPITVGVVIEGGRVVRVQVLEFRESRGSEVRQPFFTSQFTGARLNADLQLDRDIDGISGATLSVRALKKVVRLALYFHAEVMAP